MHVEDVILLWEPQLLVNTSPVQGGSPVRAGKPGESAEEGHERVLMAVIICHERTREPELLAAACHVLLKSITAMQSAREGMCKQAIYPCISSTERCTTQNASRCVISFLAIFPAPDSQSTKKRTERDLKLLFSRAHSTHHQTWPLPALLTAPLPHPSSRKGKREHFFEYFYLFLFPTVKDFSTMLYTLVMGLININDNPTTLMVADLSISKYGIYV